MSALKTTRNKIPATISPIDTPMLDEIDALYEILDAELPSHKNVYDRAMGIIKTSKTPKMDLSQFFVRNVEEVSKRDGLALGVHPDNFKAIADRLASDWDSSYGVDYRSQRDSEGPSL